MGRYRQNVKRALCALFTCVDPSVNLPLQVHSRKPLSSKPPFKRIANMKWKQFDFVVLKTKFSSYRSSTDEVLVADLVDEAIFGVDLIDF